ncbi:hypothetical protein FDP41_007122 [Naegleria fowleri]|uniref:Uncharacterized protein n=1 Tax=Naegleria fowleri TaxID=5763 RepID=A0A6A5BJ47_NAEFO|nr:uncharacterized protein FDP41_007122 [Naegleria fowleri]KAF0973735.1 hypothetical protein FDP41_007122 [Naegleria fowleri]CAG4712461.1 unnamed protein product [Naegleria fowleri]
MQETILTAETLEEGDASTFALTPSSHMGDEEYQHHHNIPSSSVTSPSITTSSSRPPTDFVSSSTAFLNDPHSQHHHNAVTTPNTAITGEEHKHHHHHEGLTEEEQHLFHYLDSAITTPPSHPSSHHHHHQDENSGVVLTPGNSNASSSRASDGSVGVDHHTVTRSINLQQPQHQQPLSSSSHAFSMEEREGLLKRISELEDHIRQLEEQLKQKDETIKNFFITQQQSYLLYQQQMAQYYPHPGTTHATTPGSTPPHLLNPSSSTATHSPVFPNFANPITIPPPHFSSPNASLLTNASSSITSPAAITSSVTSPTPLKGGISSTTTAMTTGHLLQPSMVPSMPNGPKKKKKKKATTSSGDITTSNNQASSSVVTTPSATPSITSPSMVSSPQNINAKKQTSNESSGEKKRKLTESEEEETDTDGEEEVVISSGSAIPTTPTNNSSVTTSSNSNLTSPMSSSTSASNLAPKPKATLLPPQPLKQLPKLPPRAISHIPPPMTPLDPFAMQMHTAGAFGFPHHNVALDHNINPLMMDPLLHHHHFQAGIPIHPSPSSPNTVFSAVGETSTGTGRRKGKKSDGAIDSIIGVDNIELANPVHVETEIRKLFTKVNSGGKKGVLAVHAGDGLEMVMDKVKNTLEQVEVLKSRAVTEFDEKREPRATHCINTAVSFLYAITRGVASGLLQLLDSSIAQLLDGTRENWGIEIANLLEKTWNEIFKVIFVESEQSAYTPLGSLLDLHLMQKCLEELQALGKSLSYFKFEHLTRVFNTMFNFMKKNNSIEWYLAFCLQIRYYREYCSKMIELEKYEECFDNIVNRILTGNSYALRTGDYRDEDKTYLVEYAVTCMTKVYDKCVKTIKQEYAENHIEETMPVNLVNTQYADMMDRFMGNCVNIQKIVLYPRELLPLLKFLLKVFPSDEAFTPNGGLGATNQDIRHLTFIADLLFIMGRFIVELDEYNGKIDTVQSVARKIVLESTNTLLEKLLKIKREGSDTNLKDIIEHNDLFKRSIAQICEHAVWIPIHQEEKDYTWKQLNDYNETLQIKQDESTARLRDALLDKLYYLLPGISNYLRSIIENLNFALNYKIENRNNTSYEQFFNVMKKIGTHYFKSQRDAQWEELLAKVNFIHSRKVKLKKMLKKWHEEEVKNKKETGYNWYDKLLDDQPPPIYQEPERDISRSNNGDAATKDSNDVIHPSSTKGQVTHQALKKRKVNPSSVTQTATTPVPPSSSAIMHDENDEATDEDDEE